MKYDVAIIGAGPAGIMAAISAKKNGASVVLIEKNSAIGRKILATGNGRCNITNKLAKVENYHGSSHEFIGEVLNAFDQHQTMKFFEKLGLILKEEDRGRMFPRTNQASSVVEILKHELERLQVEVKLNSEVKKIEKKSGWNIQLSNGATIYSDKLIVTTGGRAAHQFGSSGDGLFWLKNLGLKIADVYASLVPIETKEDWVKDIQGLKVEAKASFYVDEKKISERLGDLIFTHFGLSGPAIMSQSRNIAPFVANSVVRVELDFMVDQTEKDLDDMIARIFNSGGAKTVKNALAGLVPGKLIPIVLHQSSIDENKISAEISKAQRSKIVQNLKSLTLNISKLRPLKEAQVTRGGASTDEINPQTLESKKVTSLYLAGEILDVDGDSGGFNLQWSWSSGHVAGNSASIQ